MVYSLIFCSSSLLSTRSLSSSSYISLLLSSSSALCFDVIEEEVVCSSPPQPRVQRAETSNQWCQQPTLYSTAIDARKKDWLCGLVMIVWAPDKQITFIPAKAGTVKTLLYTNPNANAGILSLFPFNVTMLEVMKAQEAEVEMWSLTPSWLLFL